MAILSVLAGLYTVYSGYQQSSDLKKSGKLAQQQSERNAQLQEATTSEEARRMGNLQDMEEGQAAALAAASGIDSGSGSMAGYLGGMKNENTAQLDWLKTAGAQQASITREGGRAAKKTAGYQARSAIRSGWVSGVGSIATGLATAGAGGSGGSFGNISKASSWFT